MPGTLRELIKPPAHSIFFSHSGEDNEIIHHIIDAINSKFNELNIMQQLPVFFDAYSLIGSKEKQYDSIYNAINTSGIFIIFVTKNSLQSRWPLLELKIAMDAKKKNPDMVILPLYYHTIPNETPGLITPETEALFADFSVRELINVLRRDTGIQHPRKHFIETFESFVDLILKSVVKNTISFEPFYQFKLDQPSLFSATKKEQKDFDLIKEEINKCNTPDELHALWKNEINPHYLEPLKLLVSDAERFKWALSWARSLKYSDVAKYANEYRKVCKIWAERVYLLMSDSAEKNDFLQLKTMVEVILDLVLPMDKANALINLTSIKENRETEQGKDWISEDQKTKILALPEYKNKLSSEHNATSMEHKLVGLVEFFGLKDFQIYIQPQLLNCTELENVQLAGALLNDNPNTRTEKHQHSKQKINGIIKIQSYERRRQAVLQAGCLRMLSELHPKLTFWQSNKILTHLEHKEMSLAAKLLKESSDKLGQPSKF